MVSVVHCNLTFAFFAFLPINLWLYRGLFQFVTISLTNNYRFR